MKVLLLCSIFLSIICHAGQVDVSGLKYLQKEVPFSNSTLNFFYDDRVKNKDILDITKLYQDLEKDTLKYFPFPQNSSVVFNFDGARFMSGASVINIYKNFNYGGSKLNWKQTKKVIVHEIGHLVFIEKMIKRIPGFRKDAKLFRKHAFAMMTGNNKEMKELEKQFVDVYAFFNFLTFSIYYQELFSDLVAAFYYKDLNVMGDLLQNIISYPEVRNFHFGEHYDEMINTFDLSPMRLFIGRQYPYHYMVPTRQYLFENYLKEIMDNNKEAEFLEIVSEAILIELTKFYNPNTLKKYDKNIEMPLERLVNISFINTLDILME